MEEMEEMEEMEFMFSKPSGLSVARSLFSMLWGMDTMKSPMRKLWSSISGIMIYLSLSKHATQSFTEMPKLENTFPI